MTVKKPLLTLVAVCALLALPAAAQAETAGTGWEAFSSVYPTNLPPGGSGEIQLDILNTGAKPSSGSIVVTDTLPEGLEATKAGGMPAQGSNILSPEEEEIYEFGRGAGARWFCIGRTVVTCTSNPGVLASLPIVETGGVNGAERVGIAVTVAGDVSGVLANRVTIAGGGASSATNVSDPVTVSSTPAGPGLGGWDVWFTNANGTLDTQAGSHPYEATFVNDFNELTDGERAGGEARDVEAVLPPGFFGDPGATPQCTRTQLDAQHCPAQSQIGIDDPGRVLNGGGVTNIIGFAVYNMVPPPGVADEFAFTFSGFTAYFDTGPSSADGYRLVTHINNIPEAQVALNILTLWGVPAEASHNFQRCGPGPEYGVTGTVFCGISSGLSPKPFLTLPTSCEGPQPFTLRQLSTWADPSVSSERTVQSHDNNGTPQGFTGCEKLSIEPILSTVPDTSFADTPAGLTAEVKVPQENLENPTGLVAATLKNTTVTLPEGLVINPGQAAGLKACQEAEANIHGEGPQTCPLASKVGTVKIQTPLLEGELEPELEGDIYVLQSNPPELKLLLAASGDGIYLKLVGTVHLNPQTGQLTTTFAETPELPFTDLKLSFSGGAQAALATPTLCGSYSTTSDFTPWTTPYGEDIFPTSSLTIDAGTLGVPCPSSPLPFSPSLIAGATTDQAGGYTSFSLLLQRGDDQQRIEKLQFKAPQGLSGMISHVPLCGEPQAQAGTCPVSSQIGHTVVASGPGPFPLIVPEPGRPEAPIYLTGPYEGAPFGLSIVTPVIAGPFNLGTVVTRAKIEINPYTAQITVVTDPLPQIIDGVPTDLREVDSVIDRPEFMFNPTNCDSSSFSGTASGTPPPGVGGAGATAPIESHFKVGSCQSLKFTPQFTASTSGKTSKSQGASLTLKVARETGPSSQQANFTLAKIELPKQLPSRLTTLQKACTAAQFEANPAGCPSASDIGHVKVTTPILPVPLEGPAYFVSHGGEAFPSVIFVLQGDNVTIDVVSTTFISKSGITSATIKTVPDQPFTSFELSFPEGAYSALAANGNLCAQTKTVTTKHKITKRVHGKTVHKTITTHTTKGGRALNPLQIPTEFIAQNGLEVHQNTPVSVSGCSKTKPAKKPVKHKRKHKKK
jgi:hypothetical protein